MPNRYISLLVREGVLYFAAYVPFPPARLFGIETQQEADLLHASSLRHLLYNINSFIAGPTNANSVGVVGILTDVLSYILLFILCPRFIMSVRELYNRDTQYGWRRGSGIDSGFGFGGGGNAAMGSIRFVDGEVSITEERATDVPMVNIRTTEC